MHWSRSKIFKLLFILPPLCGMWFMGQGAYIHAKALFAQFLLEAAWSKTVHGEKEVKPWSWADTWLVARLSVTDLGIDRIVLAGASGASLAFGPGHLFGSATPGDEGHTIIAGHRDTHFRFLKEMQKGQLITLHLPSDESLDYEVIDVLVIDESQGYNITGNEKALLTLMTCYPFDALQPGGPLRYVVISRLKSTKPNVVDV